MRQLIRPSPPDWYAEFQKRGQSELESIMSGDEAERSSSALSRISFFRNSLRLSELKSILSAASHGECHVCESALQENPSTTLEHFRPKLQAGNARKDRSHPRHYWWLIYEWANLQALCPVCNRYKGSLFPISESRAHVGQYAGLINEGPMLINPFDEEPADHMAAALDGMLIPLTQKGQTTIEVYQLNRVGLCDRRRDRVRALQALVKELGVSRVATAEAKYAATKSVLDLASTEFTGFSQQILNALIRLPDKQPTPVAAKPTTLSPAAIPKKFEARWIRRVKLDNFGPFDDLEIAFPDPEGGLEPWLGIVGENGVGKSTFLKAVALALVDREKASQLIPDASVLRNRNTRRRRGFVEIEFSDQSKRRLCFERHSADFRVEGAAIGIPVIAFGANRITDRKGSARDLPTAGAVDNLFDCVLPLADTEKWLADPARVTRRNFTLFAENLKFLLDLPINTRVDRRKGLSTFTGPAVVMDWASYRTASGRLLASSAIS